jgi:hypothetical protein
MTPSRFREELKRFDKSLDFEWNGKKQEWQIVGTDRKRNRYIIKRFPIGTIGTIGLHTIKELYEVSPMHQGGAKRLNERIDAIIEEEEKAEEKAQKEAIENRLEDAWMHYQYKEGKRISLHTPKGEEVITVTDRRRVHDTP